MDPEPDVSPGAADVDADVARARTLPGEWFTSPIALDTMRELVFARSWQFVGDGSGLDRPGACLPTVLLPGMLDEPLVFVRGEDGALRGLSNVCTHRGHQVCENAGVVAGLRCRYHGRSFGLDGTFLAMPAFEGVRDFPGPADHLASVPIARWKRFLFAGVRPAYPFARLAADLDARVGWLPIDRAVLAPERTQTFEFHANWALYCDNYLEGLHIPFIHEGLHAALDFGSYRYELFDHATLQIGFAKPGDVAFDLPPGSPDAGQRIAAYYWWLFPNLMLNFYPWGLSVNRIEPLAADRTRVIFESWVWDSSRLGAGAGGDLARVEAEDEAVVTSAQRGIASRFWRGGRYSPEHERGVHRFHRLLAAFLAGGSGVPLP